MAVFKCKMCGGDLEIVEGSNICVCRYCETKQTVPIMDSDKKTTLFSRANRLRFNCEFDKAYSIYEAIIADFPEEAEAYWGLVLCKYGVEYVDDPRTAKKIPTCHRSSFNSVMDDENFEKACEYSGIEARDIYRSEAKQIEELRRDIISISSKENPYDIFICYKETDKNGDRTIDSVIAQDVYEALTRRGYRVFFSRISLEDKIGREYEPYIFSALHSAKIMLVFGTDYEHFNAVWVKNEWSRFLKLMEENEEKALIPCFKNIDAYDMPKEFTHLQAQDMGKVGAMQDLLRGIEKILELNKSSKNDEGIAFSKEIIKSVPALLNRANTFLKSDDFIKADQYFEKALDACPDNEDALIGKLLVEYHIKTLYELETLGELFHNSPSYKYAENCGKEETKSKLKSILEKNKEKVLYDLALALAEKQFKKAEELAIKVLDYEPDNPQANLNKMLAKVNVTSIEELGNTKLIVEHSKLYAKVMEVSSDDVRSALAEASKKIKESVYSIIKELVKSGDFQAADKYCTQILNYDENDIVALENKIYIWYKSRSLDEMIERDIYFEGSKTYRHFITLCDEKTKRLFEKALSKIKSSLAKKRRKRLVITALFACAFVLIACSVIALSMYISRLPHKIYSYEMIDGGATITGIKDEEKVVRNGTVKLPDKIKGEKVVKIGNKAFEQNHGIKKVVLGQYVVEIGDYAFADCKHLEDIELNEGVTKIGLGAFAGNGNLTKIYVPASVMQIRANAFSECYYLTIIAGADQAQSGWDSQWNPLNLEVFYGGYVNGFIYGEYKIGLKKDNKAAILEYKGSSAEIIIPNRVGKEGYIVDEICPFAFNDKQGTFETVIIPDTVSIISQNAFGKGTGAVFYCHAENKPDKWQNGWNLGNRVVWNYSSHGITSDSFVWCKTKNNEAVIVRYIGNEKDIVVPDKIDLTPVTEISDYAFRYKKLSSVKIPASIVKTGENLFSETVPPLVICQASQKPSAWAEKWCSNATVIWDVINMGSENGYDWILGNGEAVRITGYNGTEKNVIIPKELNGYPVTKIDRDAFSGQSALKTVRIPESIGAIGENSFNGCEQLIIYCEAKEKPSGWEQGWDNSVTNIVFGCSQELEKDGFRYIKANEGIVILEFIGANNGEIVFPRQIDGVNVVKIASEAIKNYHSKTIIYIPHTITSAMKKAFDSCTELLIYFESEGQPKDFHTNWNSTVSSIIYDVKSFGKTDDGFKYIVNGNDESTITSYVGTLTTVTVPSAIDGHTVTTIGKACFMDNRIIKEVKIPSTVTTVDMGAFMGCTELCELVIPQSVTYVNEYAIYNSNKLTVYCEAGEQPSTFHNDWNASGNPVIYNFKEKGITADFLKWYADKNNEATIYGYTGSLNTVQLPSEIQGNTVKSIAKNAFYSNQDIKRLIIPSSIVSIEKDAIKSCNSLIIFSACDVKPTQYQEGWTDSQIVYWSFKSSGSGDGYEWYVNNSNIATVVSYTGDNENIDIPSALNGYTVNRIGKHAFNNLNAQSITVPSTVKIADENAFNNCNNLVIYYEGVEAPATFNENWNGNIPSYVNCRENGITAEGIKWYTSDGERVTVTGITDVEAVIIGEKISSYAVFDIADGAFSNRSALKEITIPNTISTIRRKTFSNCTNLQNVTLPYEIATIEAFAFQNCTSLKKIRVYNASTVKAGAFYGCDSLTVYTEHLTAPSGWEENIGSAELTVLHNCRDSGVTDGLTWERTTKDEIVITAYTVQSASVTIPQEINGYPVTEIGAKSFTDNTTIRTVTISEGVTKIGNDAFNGCKYLNTITFPSSLTTINVGAFKNCDRLSSVSLGENVTYLGMSAFEGCGSLRSFEFSGKLDSILPYTFADCKVLKSFTIPETVKHIGTYAFKNCSGIKRITIPNGVTDIGAYAFQNYAGGYVYIPESVSFVGACAFWGISTTLFCEAYSQPSDWSPQWNTPTTSNPTYYGCTQGVTENGLKWINTAYDGVMIVEYVGGQTTKLTIPGEIEGKTVTTLWNKLFMNNEGLVKVTIEEGITRINERVFAGCENLEEVVFPESLTYIGTYAFNSCDNLKKIIIPLSVTTICDEAFNLFSYDLVVYCRALKKPSGWSSSWGPAAATIIWDYKE